MKSNSDLSTLLDEQINAKVIQYINENGFGSPIPKLTSSLDADEFKKHYYDKIELVKFCRFIGIPVYGLKDELNKRIEIYLRTGKKVNHVARKKSKPDSESGLSLNKQVVHYKSDIKTRDFFQTHIPEFVSFSAMVQKEIKQRIHNNEIFYYQDIIDMHKTYLKEKSIRKNTNQAPQVAHDSCQFNQFAIDYKHDPSSKIHTMRDAWMLVRNSAGAKTYQRYKLQINKIKDLVR